MPPACGQRRSPSRHDYHQGIAPCRERDTAPPAVGANAIETCGLQAKSPLRPDELGAGTGIAVLGQHFTREVLADQQVGPALRRDVVFDGLAELDDDVASRAVIVDYGCGELGLFAKAPSARRCPAENAHTLRLHAYVAPSYHHPVRQAYLSGPRTGHRGQRATENTGPEAPPRQRGGMPVSYRLKKVRSRWTDTLTQVGWDEFERRVAEYYREQGYRVEHTGTGSSRAMSDGGIDIKLYRDGEYTVVQCKHWNVGQVPHNAVHELIGVMHTEGAQRAILITSGEFTDHAMRSAEKFMPIQLIGGAQIRAMLGPLPEQAPAPLPGHETPSWAAPNSRRRPQAPPSVTSTLVAATLAIILVGYLYITNVMNGLGAPLNRNTQPRPVGAPAAAAGPAQRDGQSPPPRDASRSSMPRPAQAMYAAPITTPDGRPAARGITPNSKEEMADWERENAKSMKILEKTTPAL